MKKCIIFLCLTSSTVLAYSQTLGGYAISGLMVSAVHPNGCNSDYVTGTPEDSIWVNFSPNDIMTGNFGASWTDTVGDELLLETGFHADNYNVRLLLSTGLYSVTHNVSTTDWIQITDVPWKTMFTSCTDNTIGLRERFILPLDFNAHFGLISSDTVIGIEITFLNTFGSPDLAGVYIIICDTINLGNDTTLCQGETLILDATTSNATYLWQDNSTIPIFNVTQQGTYWVEVTDSCGITSDTINVSYNPFPTVNLGNDTTLCQGETLILDATTSNATYLWQDNSTNPTFNGTQQGTYWVEVTVNNCSATDTINVTYNTLPAVGLGNDTTLCQGETLTLDATTSNATYLWQDNSTNPTFNVTQQGINWVEVTNSCGTTTDTINVTYNPLPAVDLGNDTTLCQGETLTLDATISNVTYLWQDNSTNPTFNVTQQGTYWVEVTVNNCSTTDTIRIDLCETSITIGPSFAYIPNVFYTASNNPENEKLFVFGKNIRSFELSIYDRWGEIVYETIDSSEKLRSDGACCAYGEGWDGTFRNTGKPLNEAVFVFILNGEFADGRKFNESGNITLIK